MLVIEDVHWSDQASLEYFLYLARRLDDRPSLARCLNRLGNWHTNLEQPLAALQFHQEAETVLLTFKAALETQEARPLLWRVNLALAGLYLKLKRPEAAAGANRTAQTLIAEIAAELDDPVLQAPFQRQAQAQIPAVPVPSERQASKKAWAGLTGREREVALLVAQGKTNREIAEILVLNKRTVESYLDHIFSKLDFNSRIQLATWVFEKGWLHRPE